MKLDEIQLTSGIKQHFIGCFLN